MAEIYLDFFFLLVILMIVSDSHKSEVHEPHGQKTTSPEHGEERKAESKGS